VSNDQLFQSRATEIQSLSLTQIEAWSTFARSAAIPNPFFEPECQIPSDDFHVDGGSNCELLVAEHEGEIVACVPVHITRPGIGPFRRRVAHSRSVWTPVSFGALLVSPTMEDHSISSLLAAMRCWSREGGPGIAVFDWLDDDAYGTGGQIRAVCEEQGIPLLIRRMWERPVARRLGANLSLRETMSATSRRKLERNQRRLESALGGIMELVDRSGDPLAVDEFLKLESSGWKGPGGFAYAVRPEAEQWFRALCANFAALGRLQLLSLEVAGRTVVMQCWITGGDVAYGMRIGHDAELSTFGPGRLMHVAAIDHLDSIGINLADPCASPGDASRGNAVLNSLYKQRRPMVTLAIATGGYVDRSALRAVKFVAPFVERSRRIRRPAKALTKASDLVLESESVDE